uniref:gluconokinase n=1 Tax=Nocardia abscessus TaxID=120957 RepID=UPI003CC7E33C
SRGGPGPRGPPPPPTPGPPPGPGAPRPPPARGAVVTCSALKRIYRDQLRASAPDAFFLHLDLPHGELERRLAERRGHFMPPSLLDSQLATLEPLEPDEDGSTVDGTLSPDDLVREAVAALER